MKTLRMLAIAFLSAASVAPVLAAPAKAAKPLVAVSIIPQAYFVNRIAGGRVEVLTLVGPGQSPHSYEPTPRQMADISKAAAWFTIGMEFESSLVGKVRSLYPGLKLVDTAAKLERRRLEEHHHGEEGEDHRGEESGPDPHTWLGRDEAKVQAEEIRAALTAVDPAGKDTYRKNCAAFVADIDKTFGDLAKALEPLRGTTVYVYHPAFGYFLDEFGIVQEAVETGGKEPTQKGLAELAARAKGDGARVIFVQAQFPSAAAQTLAKAIGGVVRSLDDLAPDWLANIERMGAALKEAAR